MSDSINRQWLMECVNEGWIKFDTEKDENRFIHLVRDIAPSAQPEPSQVARDIATIIENERDMRVIAAQPERNTAEWIYGEKDGADGWYCSKCGFHIPWYYDYYGLNNINFIRDFHTCPHCDSKMMKYTGMDGEQDG